METELSVHWSAEAAGVAITAPHEVDSLVLRWMLMDVVLEMEAQVNVMLGAVDCTVAVRRTTPLSDAD